MKYRRLGNTGLRVSVVGVGTWQFGGEWGKQFSQPEADRILGRARELGINLIDTAECYGDHLSESLVGQAIQHKRDEWVLATKFGHRFIGYLEREDLWSPEEVRRQLEDSLQALRTEFVDLYQFHSGSDEAFDNDALWTMLGKQKEAGKIRHLDQLQGQQAPSGSPGYRIGCQYHPGCVQPAGSAARGGGVPLLHRAGSGCSGADPVGQWLSERQVQARHRVHCRG
jgi:aryl-alcohol dehydrogenase-like predicted oxidoreductase